MDVGTILGQKGRRVVTAKTDMRLLEAAKLLSVNGIGSLVVQDGDATVVGIISERDIVRGIADLGPHILKKPISSLMTTEVVTCKQGDRVDRIMEIMTSRRFRHLPVVENDQLVGIVSIGDVVKSKIASVEMEAEAMRDYIVAAR